MAVAFTRFSHWVLRGNQKPCRCRTKSPPPAADFPSGFRDSEAVKLNFSKRNFSNLRESDTRRNTSSSPEKSIDPEHDMVIVPSDSESDGSDWSIGWLEPHPHHFRDSDADSEDSFAVLVPCYRTPAPARARADAPFAFPFLPTPDRVSGTDIVT